MEDGEERIDSPDSDNSDEEGPSTPAKRKKKQQPAPKVFQQSWLENPDFKGWLARVPNNIHMARCLCCRKDLKCGKSELQKHCKGPSHVTAAKGFKGSTPIASAFAAQKRNPKEIHEASVKRAEIGFAAYFAEHNVAFQNADHMMGVVKRAATDSQIIQDVKLGRDKCSAIVKNIIGKTETEELVEDLKKNDFSIMVDESTDIARVKQMCILVRYFLITFAKPRTALLELVDVDAHDCSGEALWNKFVECLGKHQIPITNILGLGADNAAVMIGPNNSFWSRLRAVCPWAVKLSCICHTSALISKSACKALPTFVQSHLRSVLTYISASPKRTAELTDFQELYEEELSKLLKLSDTRWLILQPVVERYLKHYDSIYAYFRTTVRESPKEREARAILDDMSNIFLKAYFPFLEYALVFFNKFNAFFQSADVQIHKLHDASKKLLKTICQNYLRPEELERLETTNLSHPSNFLKLEDVYLGPKCTRYLDDLQVPIVPGEKKTAEQVKKDKQDLEGMKSTFRLKCLEFYRIAAEEMKARLPSGRMFAEMAFLDPAIALSANARVTLPSLDTLATNFQEKLSPDLNAIAIEWRTMPTEIDNPLKEKLRSMPVAEMWSEIASLKDFSDEKVFPQLTRLACCILSLPHSNADAERIYSIVTDVKTSKRNRLGQESLNAIAVTRSSFKDKGVFCSTFPIKKTHLDKFNKSIYESKD